MNDAGAPHGRLDDLLVVGSAMAVSASAALGLVVFVDPAVSRLGWAFALSVAAAVGGTAVVCRRATARAVARRWSGPLIGLALGLPYIVTRATWSSPPWMLALLPFLVVLFIAHFVLVCVSASELRTNRRVGVAGFVVVAASWASILGPLPDSTLRRARVSLAAPDLVVEAQALLERPPRSAPQGAFVATAPEGAGRVVGWPIGTGMLGNGEALVWDPDGVLGPDGAARTTGGYPWLVDGRSCQPIIDDWRYCWMN